MTTLNIQFFNKIEKNPRISLNRCFLRLSEFPRDAKSSSYNPK